MGTSPIKFTPKPTPQPVEPSLPFDDTLSEPPLLHGPGVVVSIENAFVPTPGVEAPFVVPASSAPYAYQTVPPRVAGMPCWYMMGVVWRKSEITSAAGMLTEFGQLR